MKQTSCDEEIIRGLAEDGYVVLNDYVSQELINDLRNDLVAKKERGLFKPAGIGQGKNHHLANEIRRDEICWFEPTDLTSPQKLFWEELERVRELINQNLYLGLWDLEGHYASYGPGGFYRRHLDRFKSDDLRAVSIVLYLNEDWPKSGAGGELILYKPEGAGDDSEIERVTPAGGTLVIFLSDRIPHEVCPSLERTRLSFAGWFRRRGLK